MKALFVGVMFLLGAVLLNVAVILLLVSKSNDAILDFECRVVQIIDKKLVVNEAEDDSDESYELIIYYKYDDMLFGLSAMNVNELRLFHGIQIGEFIEACTNNKFRVIKKVNATSI